MARRRSKSKGGTKSSVWDEATKAAIEDRPKTPDELVRTVTENKVECDVEFVTYRATNRGESRTIHILCANGTAVSLAEAYRGKGPALYSGIEYTLAARKSQAFFRLRNSGFPKETVTPYEGRIKNAFDLWEGPFREFHEDPAAKLQFLKLVGAQAEGSSYTRIAKKAQEVEAAREHIETNDRYAGVEGFGMF